MSCVFQHTTVLVCAVRLSVGNRWYMVADGSDPCLLCARPRVQFANQCGVVYKGGNVVFSADGNCLLSPVGNRVTVFDLVE